MLRELLETEHELVHTRYRISHENRGTIGQTVYVFSDFILLDSDLCVSLSTSWTATCVGPLSISRISIAKVPIVHSVHKELFFAVCVQAVVNCTFFACHADRERVLYMS